jgi:excisionase family DNA binding protein
MIGNEAEERLLSTAEVSKWLRVATRTICTWAECGELPATKIGRQWRFRRSDLKIWLERPRQRRKEKSAQPP